MKTYVTLVITEETKNGRRISNTAVQNGKSLSNQTLLIIANFAIRLLAANLGIEKAKELLEISLSANKI